MFELTFKTCSCTDRQDPWSLPGSPRSLGAGGGGSALHPSLRRGWSVALAASSLSGQALSPLRPLSLGSGGGLVLPDPLGVRGREVRSMSPAEMLSRSMNCFETSVLGLFFLSFKNPLSA